MKKISLLLLLITTLISGNLYAQYYYKDIVSTRQAQEEKKVLRSQQIRTIKVHSFETNGDPSPGFFCEKKINKDYRRIETYTKSDITGKSILKSFYNEMDQLIESRDSSDLSVTSSAYQYDESGRISIIISNSHSHDDDFATRLLENHQYFYNAGGIPEKMLRIRNNKDSAWIIFTADNHGNIIDENDPGKNGKHYYYYYNDRNWLSDIVKFNEQKGKLLPEFSFEYNSAGQITQMIAVEEGINSEYYTWKYTYNEGLRIIEKCFSKQKTLMGYIEYEYN